MEKKFQVLLESVSRTFALSINHLPDMVKDAITLSYMLLRVSDILEDNYVKPKEEKIEDLNTWVKILHDEKDVQTLIDSIQVLNAQDPEVIVALRAAELLEFRASLPEEVQEIVTRYVCETTEGMARWQKQGPFIDTVKDMDDYMHEVAGRVGYLITEIFALHSKKVMMRKEELMPLSREFGLALQTVNIIQGMKKDYERGWIFTPKAYFDSVGITADEFFSIADEKKSLQVINLMVEKAEFHLRNGLDYVMRIPKSQFKIRLACMWPLFFAVKTLILSNNNLDILRRDDVKITRNDVKEIIASTTLKGISNTWVKRYYQQLFDEAKMSTN